MTHKFYTPTTFKYHIHDSQDQHQVQHLGLNMEATLPLYMTLSCLPLGRTRKNA